MTRRATQRRPRGPADGARPRLRALAVAVLLPAAAAFAPPALPRRARPPGRAAAADDAAFDPFARSPLSFGAPEPPAPAEAGAPDPPGATDARAAAGAADAASAPPARAAADLEFDPRLSPHAYPDGTDAGPAPEGPPAAAAIAGVLLIDHGSRREASNAHIHAVARTYEDRLRRRGGATRVRAAHMEIAAPSILDSLRALAEAGATRIVCVPYFLSPGRHATEDVPALIAAARADLAGEGCAAEVTTSAALGTQLDGMLGAVDALVEGSLQ